ncbi:MAG TPA: polyprenyl synthetase family protein [Candidatus Marinimicrobia bacterium]|nr:polyprenyl synthetase family protein [Candidatus Neomarinimicrobiota bacterium]HRS50933.1 polyprenyl synthetase family protein [Candidatus Neomarinimicrobiota bacterium]HRU91725.1 polyprenyl synthetase family protein [Candidatus Neomarinimicrobiota bacterium]
MPQGSLNDIFAPISTELGLFQKEFRQALYSDVELINQIGNYLLSGGGKYIRPALVLLSARLCGEPNEHSIIAASVVEILHTATLVHDDIIDDAEFRRGQPSVKAIWSNKIAVLAGDFLFSRALSNMLRLRNFTVLELLSQTSELLSSGELLQLEKSLNNNMNEEIYYQVIWAKTASLFATACQVGALTVSADEEQSKALFDYGRNLGLAFQIKDDLFDCTGTSVHTGKPVARDIKQNLITLPLIHTLKTLPPEDRRQIRQQLKNYPSPEQINAIAELIVNNNGITYAENKCQELIQQAISALDIFPDSEYKSTLTNLANYTLTRNK